MKKILTAVVVAFAAIANAAPPPTEVVLNAKNGNVTFNHKAHQEALKDCTKCHSKPEGGKIEGFGKELAHNTCKGCHSESKKGPTSCKECHK